MSSKSYFAIAALVLLALIGIAGAKTAISDNASSSSQAQALGAFLTSYNVSASTQSAFTYVNISYNSGNYLLAYLNGDPNILINSTSGYAFVINPASIQQIITPTVVQSSLSEINTSYLSSKLLAYNASAVNMTECLTDTGLNIPGQSCTVANYCESCAAVPYCGGLQRNPPSYLSQFGLTMVYAIVNLEQNYTWLESNISIYSSSVNALTSSATAQSGLTGLNSAFANITTLTQTITTNPLWSPQSIPTDCNVTLPPSEQSDPQCRVIAYCNALSYNYTILGQLNDKIGQVNLLPISPVQISGIAQTLSNNANAYAGVIIANAQLKQRNEILNTTLAGYVGISSGVTSLLASVSNATLATRMSTLSANYSILVNTYTTVNLATLNSTLKMQYVALKAVYDPLNASYYSALTLSQENTALLLSLESESGTPSSQLVALSFEEVNLNDQLTSSKISNINAVAHNLSALNAQIKAAPHSSNILGEVSRAVGVPLGSVLLSSTSYSSAVADAPLVAMIIPILVSVIILVALYLLHKRLRKHGKLRRADKTDRNWKILFVIVALILLFYLFESYNAAVIANTASSLSDASAAIGRASSVVIAINGTSNSYLVNCEAKITQSLDSASKTVHKITINGQACGAGAGIETTDECLAQYAASGTPVIILTNSTKNTLTAYSYYGTVLSQSGNAQFTNSCLASLFLG